MKGTRNHRRPGVASKVAYVFLGLFVVGLLVLCWTFPKESLPNHAPSAPNAPKQFPLPHDQPALAVPESSLRSRLPKEVVPRPNPATAPIAAKVAQPPSSSAPSGGTTLGLDTLLLIICAHRPDYLQRTLAAVQQHHPQGQVPILISQDGMDAKVSGIIKASLSLMQTQNPGLSLQHKQHPSGRYTNGYFALAAHYKWALDEAFRAPSIKRVIILEEDLVIAPDFFEMLAANKDILDSDPSLMGVSAWNDNGQTTAVKDNKQMYRSDFFPGLGWMLTRTVWEELSPKWPEAYWDDWLREPKNRKDRQFLRPEVCRTLHIGQRGVSNAQYSAYLTSTLLNSDFVPFTTMDLGYLQKDRWEREFLEQVRAATPLSIADAKSSKSQSRDIRVAYDSLEGGGSSFAVLAAWAGAMNNVKAGVPRTAFRGIVSLWRGDTKVHLVPSSFQ